MLTGYWLVADMDGCLTPTPSKGYGQYLPLSAAATHRHVLRFLELGGSLCVVSTAGRRMWRQVLQEIRPALFPTIAIAASGGGGRFALCALSGAVCFLSDSSSQSVKRVSDYATTFEPSTGIQRSETLLEGNMAEWAKHEGRAAVVRFFELAAHVNNCDVQKARDWFTKCLSRKYVEPYTQLLDRMLAESRASSSGSSSPCFENSEYLRMEHLTLHGKYIEEPKDALVDVQCVPCDDGTLPDLNASPSTISPSTISPSISIPIPNVSSTVEEAAQISVLGIPMSLYDDIFFPLPTSSLEYNGKENSKENSKENKIQHHTYWSCPHCKSGAKAATALQDFKEHDLVCKSQPNSICIARSGVDKAVCVRWLIEQGKAGTLDFDLTRAIAFGDVPSSVDKPLTQFPPMPFVSLSLNPERDPPGLLHVGGEEEGTALFLEELLESITSTTTTTTTHPSCVENGDRDVEKEQQQPEKNYFSLDRVTACATRAKERMEEKKAKAAIS